MLVSGRAPITAPGEIIHDGVNSLSGAPVSSADVLKVKMAIRLGRWLPALWSSASLLIAAPSESQLFKWAFLAQLQVGNTCTYTHRVHVLISGVSLHRVWLERPQLNIEDETTDCHRVPQKPGSFSRCFLSCRSLFGGAQLLLMKIWICCFLISHQAVLGWQFLR